jgi:hypothetical protein
MHAEIEIDSQWREIDLLPNQPAPIRVAVAGGGQMYQASGMARYNTLAQTNLVFQAGLYRVRSGNKEGEFKAEMQDPNGMLGTLMWNN